MSGSLDFRSWADRRDGAPRVRSRRKAVVAVQVMVLLTALMGMAALTVDIGYLWNVRADLQRTADAAALAAAASLAELDSPADKARLEATEFVQNNDVFNEGVTLAVNDIELGRSTLVDGQYQFEGVGDDQFPDSVRIRLSVTRQLFFAPVLGKHYKTLEAEATALLVPRDIAIVCDLSASHNDDSELGAYADTTINIWDVWGKLPGGSDSAETTWTPESLVGVPVDENNFHPQTAGPAYGYFRNLKWGEEDVTAGYSPAADAGLIHLPRYGTGTSDWAGADLATYLDNLTFANNAQYSATELTQIKNTALHSNSTRYRRQVAVALGLARWNSGKAGGAWASIPGSPSGNGDNNVDSSELTWLEPYFDEPGDRWLDYIYWDTSSTTRMAGANTQFQNAFGPKTFTNYLLESRWSNADTPELAGTPHQPMQAVKDAVEELVSVVSQFENDDQISLEVYGYTALHRVPLTSRPHLDDITTGPNGLSNMQAGHIDGWTNIGGGLERAIETLTEEPARPAAHKMIVLLTDGQANINEAGQWPSGSYADQQEILEEARQYTLNQAAIAAGLGMRIFGVAVGANADSELMDQVAAIGNGESLTATSNDISEYQAALEEIFIRLGGKRPVELIN